MFSVTEFLVGVNLLVYVFAIIFAKVQSSDCLPNHYQLYFCLFIEALLSKLNITIKFAIVEFSIINLRKSEYIFLTTTYNNFFHR